jgi:hypothetical protein
MSGRFLSNPPAFFVVITGAAQALAVAKAVAIQHFPVICNTLLVRKGGRGGRLYLMKVESAVNHGLGIRAERAILIGELNP